MSHFVGLVIMTPQYAEFHDFEDSLEKYDEQLEVPEYSRGEVSDYDKIRFIEYYLEKDGANFNKLKEKLYAKLSKEKKIETPYSEEDGNWVGYLWRIAYNNKEEYVKIFKKAHQDYFDRFAELYKEHGEDWNSFSWRISPISNKWEEYSTYNPDSVYDWYSVGGRWDSSIKTKDGEYVNECLLGEIDWTDYKPEDYEEEEKEYWDGTKYKPLKEGIKWHFTKSSLPYCAFIDGEHISKGDMGWFGMSSNDKENWDEELFDRLSGLPENSYCYVIDFHI